MELLGCLEEDPVEGPASRFAVEERFPLGARGHLPGGHIEDTLRFLKQCVHTLPRGYMLDSFEMYLSSFLFGVYALLECQTYNTQECWQLVIAVVVCDYFIVRRCYFFLFLFSFHFLLFSFLLSSSIT